MALTTITSGMLPADIISDHTNIGAQPAGSDEVLLSDAGVLKAVTVDNLIAGASGGGKVLQYLFVTDNTGIDVTGTSWAEISTSVRISLTPTHADNVVICSFNAGRFVKGAHNTSLGVAIHGHDGSISSNFGTPSDDWGIAGSYYNSTEGFPYREMNFWGIDDLSLGTAWSSGAITYKLFGRSDSTTTHQINVNDDTYWMFSVMEIDKT